MKAILASVSCLALGLGVGYLCAASRSDPVTRVEPAVATGAIPARAEVREIVRREIVRDERVEKAPPPAVDEARIERARLVVERAKTRGTWLESDRDTLRDEMEGLSGPTKAEIAAAFSDAVNRGELRIETEVPL